MKSYRKTVVLTIIVVMLLAPVFVFAGGGKDTAEPVVETEAAPAKAEPFNLAVVVPGVTAGSALYEQLVAGAEKAVGEYPNASMKVVELGFNQAEWSEKVTSIVATGIYDVVITSNPSMPFVCMDIASKFPDQKFIFVDGFIEGHPQMASYVYNQVEQSYLLGYLAGLITTSDMEGANPDLKIGMVVAQEYKALNVMMIPGFIQGAQAVNSGITLDTRVVGNWYDANKAAELAKSMMDSGVDVIGVIAGGAAPGVFEAAGERNKYVMFWDDNAYGKAPGVIAGCGILHQSKLVYEVVVDAINGKIEYGTGTKLHTRDGYIEFATDDPDYINTVPADLREKLQTVFDSIYSGSLVLEVPEL